MSYSGSYPSRPIAIRTATASFTACQGAPVSTVACHGWRLPPEGARCAAAKISLSNAGSTGLSVKARTERRACNACVTLMSVAGIFILSPFPEQQLAFEPGFQLAVIGKQEHVILFGDGSSNLGADRVGDVAHRARVAPAQDTLQFLQLENAVDRELGLAERHRIAPCIRRA